MNIKSSIAIVIAAMFVTPVLADDDDRPRRSRGAYFVEDRDEWRDRLKDEIKWREEADKRARERAREWEKLERERIKELEKLERKRHEEWEKFQRDRDEQGREFDRRTRERWDGDRNNAYDRDDFWRHQRRPGDRWPAPPVRPYDPRFNDRERWFEDEFDNDLDLSEPPHFEHRWNGDPRFQHGPPAPWGGYPHPRGFYGRRDYDDDDDDDDDDDGDDD